MLCTDFSLALVIHLLHSLLYGDCEFIGTKKACVTFAHYGQVELLGSLPRARLYNSNNLLGFYSFEVF